MSCLQDRHPDITTLFAFYPESDDAFKPGSAANPVPLSVYALYRDNSSYPSLSTLRDPKVVVACVATAVVLLAAIVFGYRRCASRKETRPQHCSSKRMAFGGLTGGLPLGGGDGMSTLVRV